MKTKGGTFDSSEFPSEWSLMSLFRVPLHGRKKNKKKKRSRRRGRKNRRMTLLPEVERPVNHESQFRAKRRRKGG